MIKSLWRWGKLFSCVLNHTVLRIWRVGVQMFRYAVEEISTLRKTNREFYQWYISRFLYSPHQTDSKHINIVQTRCWWTKLKIEYFLKKVNAIRNLLPLYLVLNFYMNIFSHCFPNSGSWLKIFTIIVFSMSIEHCPFKLKCTPVVFEVFLSLTYPLYFKNLSLRFISLSPIYCWGHFLHCMRKCGNLNIDK